MSFITTLVAGSIVVSATPNASQNIKLGRYYNNTRIRTGGILFFAYNGTSYISMVVHLGR